MADWNAEGNEVFLAAAEVESPAERRLFLDQHCGNDPGLLSPPGRLLFHHGQCYAFPGSPAFRHPVMEHSMGLFCVNFHFRTTDDRTLTEALSRRGITRDRVVPAKSGWTSLYEEQASEQDDRRIRDLGSGLSEDLHVAAIAFLVHDSDIACYWLFDKGQLLDEYNSDPDYFADSDGPPSPSGGRPDVLLRYCRPGVRQDELATILAEETVQATTFA